MRRTRIRTTSAGRRLLELVGYALLVLAFSVLSVLRYTADQLNSDGVIVSVMSLQRGSFFGWSPEGRSTAVSLLASPIADPGTNLAVCLGLSAVGVHLLLLVASMGLVRVLRLPAHRTAVLVSFLLAVAGLHLGLTPTARYALLLEGQSFGWAWFLAVTSLLVRAGGDRRRRRLAPALVLPAVVLDPSTLVLTVVAGLVAAARAVPAQRRPWLVYSVTGVGVGLVWWLLSTWLRGRALTVDWDPGAVSTGWGPAMVSVFDAYRPVRVAVALALVAVAVLMLGSAVRARSGTALAGAVLVGTSYLIVVTGRPVVSLAGDAVRFFYPLVVLSGLLLVPALAGLLLAVVDRRLLAPPAGRALDRAMRALPAAPAWVPLGVAGLVALVALVAMVGALHRPSAADVFAQTRTTVDDARARGVGFVSGDYWSVWPVVHQLLTPGRFAAFGAVAGVDQDAAAATRLLSQQVAERGSATALCIDAAVSECATELQRGTGGAWTDTGATCPLAATVSPNIPPGGRTCRVLRSSGS